MEDPDPGAAIVDGLKLAVAPEGSPEALKDTGELKPPVIVLVIVVAPLAPWFMLSDGGDAAMVNPPAGFTVSESVVV